jgi:hypothetical protein
MYTLNGILVEFMNLNSKFRKITITSKQLIDSLRNETFLIQFPIN